MIHKREIHPIGATVGALVFGAWRWNDLPPFRALLARGGRAVEDFAFGTIKPADRTGTKRNPCHSIGVNVRVSGIKRLELPVDLRRLIVFSLAGLRGMRTSFYPNYPRRD